jgi:hypothetical protein
MTPGQQSQARISHRLKKSPIPETFGKNHESQVACCSVCPFTFPSDRLDNLIQLHQRWTGQKDSTKKRNDRFDNQRRMGLA